jgi:hypothetical protein
MIFRQLHHKELHVKIFMLAREVKHRAAMVTAGRDLHDIHTTLHLLNHSFSLVIYG